MSNQIEVSINIQTQCPCCNQEVTKMEKRIAHKLDVKPMYFEALELPKQELYGVIYNTRMNLFKADGSRFETFDMTLYEQQSYLGESK